MLKITPAGGSEAVYYTQALEAETEFSFTISNGNKKVTCQLIAAWGVPDVLKTTNKNLIDSGNTIEINGGTFKAVTPANTLNCKDGSNAKITVKGGSFYKYDPSNPTLGDNEVVVAAGYHVVQDGDWFNVVAD